MIKVKIKENSWIAKIAARQMKFDSVAIVFGKTIFLHNTTRENFLKNKKWVRHEIAHVDQYSFHGFIGFIVLYLWESFNNGYTNNRFEVDARARENDQHILSKIDFS